MSVNASQLPGDFTPVTGCVPTWIDIGGVCKDAKRYVGMYAVANFDVVAINNGMAVYTTSDRNGEFRRNFRQTVGRIYCDEIARSTKDPTLVYDCELRREFLAPRESAVKFLYSQF